MIYQIKKINPVALNKRYERKTFVLEDPIVLTLCTVSLGTRRRLEVSYYLHLQRQVLQDF
jgi:hypothetical protein